MASNTDCTKLSRDTVTLSHVSLRLLRLRTMIVGPRLFLCPFRCQYHTHIPHVLPDCFHIGPAWGYWLGYVQIPRWRFWLPTNSAKEETTTCGTLLCQITKMTSRSRQKPEVVLTSDRNDISVKFQGQHTFSGSPKVMDEYRTMPLMTDN